MTKLTQETKDQLFRKWSEHQNETTVGYNDLHITDWWIEQIEFLEDTSAEVWCKRCEKFNVHHIGECPFAKPSPEPVKEIEKMDAKYLGKYAPEHKINELVEAINLINKKLK